MIQSIFLSCIIVKGLIVLFRQPTVNDGQGPRDWVYCDNGQASRAVCQRVRTTNEWMGRATPIDLRSWTRFCARWRIANRLLVEFGRISPKRLGRVVSRPKRPSRPNRRREMDAEEPDVLIQKSFGAQVFAASGPIDRVVVRLRLTGQMEAWTVSGENVLPTGRKTRALLAAIALSAPRPALRSRLAELLWSRRPEEQARASLRQEIQLLLKALAPAKTEVLRVTRDHLALLPGVTWADVDEIMRGPAPKQAALSLLDGELLEDLDGVDPAFDMWLSGERERLRDRARGMAESLMREQTRPDAIINAAQRLLQIDRSHEEAWRALMRAYADQGERGMAIQAYDRCRAVLADQLDAVPSAETQALSQEVRGPSSKRLPPRPPQPAPEPPKPEAGDGGSPQHAKPRARSCFGGRIAVWPLRSVGLSDDTAYLGASLANEITTSLSRFRSFSVISSNSLAGTCPENRDPAAIRRARDVDYLVDGAIQRSRNNLRVTLRLLDLRDDNQIIWARRFDRPDDDPLLVQEEISGEVAAQIERVILASESKRLLAGPRDDQSAYDLSLRALPLMVRLEKDGFMRAGEWYSRALAIDPDLAVAHAWYTAWHILQICQGWAPDPAAAGARAVELAERAITLDPFSPWVFTVAGHMRAIVQHSPHEAIALQERALQLNPNYALGWAYRRSPTFIWAISMKRTGATGAIRCCRRSIRFRFCMTELLRRPPCRGGRPQNRGGDRSGRDAAGSPTYAAGHVSYLCALGHLNDKAEAAAVLRRLRMIDPGMTLDRSLRAFPFERPADREHFIDGLRRAGVTLTPPAWTARRGRRGVRRRGFRHRWGFCPPGFRCSVPAHDRSRPRRRRPPRPSAPPRFRDRPAGADGRADAGASAAGGLGDRAAAGRRKGWIRRRHRGLVRGDGAVPPSAWHPDPPHRHHPHPEGTAGPRPGSLRRQPCGHRPGGPGVLARLDVPGILASLPGRSGRRAPGRGRAGRDAAEVAFQRRGRPGAAGGRAHRAAHPGRPGGGRRGGAGPARPGGRAAASGGARLPARPDQDAARRAGGGVADRDRGAGARAGRPAGRLGVGRVDRAARAGDAERRAGQDRAGWVRTARRI